VPNPSPGEQSDTLFRSGLDSGGKIRPTASDLKVLGPDFEKRWDDYFTGAPDKPVIWVGEVSA
jgi:alcohol oxidase